MASKMYINDAGAFRRIKEVWVNDAGTWRKIKYLWVKKSGAWRRVYQAPMQLAITANTQNYDLFTAAGSPATDVEIVLTISIGVIVGSAAVATPAIYASSPLPAGSTLIIINKGTILGKGGDGGTQNQTTLVAPEAGGDAIQLPCNTILNNATGLLGGGGGGGGCAWRRGTSINVMTHGYGGGGGAGSAIGGHGSVWGDSGAFVNPGVVEDCEDGNGATGGRGITAYFGWGPSTVYPPWWSFTALAKGGDLGVDGATPATWDTAGSQAREIGGLAGAAVDLNGYALTITAGETASQIKGAYD